VADTVAGASPDPHVPVSPTLEGDPNRRDFIHIATGVAAAGIVGGLAWPFIDQMNPAGDTLALASIEFDLGKVVEGQQVTIKFQGKPLFVRHRTAKEIVEGQQVVVKWRGKPLFIRYRTAKEIQEAIKGDTADLRDPATDESRHKAGKAQYLVLVGTCTHLGCVPTFGGGDYGGWFCPCHGSVYDTSGRIRKGPAPKNLEVPDYSFLSDSKVKVG
jgi:ubiquinol-cytochrome c reductase iron-sulfur subunit